MQRTACRMWILGMALCLGACAHHAPPPEPPKPYPKALIMDKSGVRLNTLTLTLGEFPLLKSIDVLPPPERCTPLPRAELERHVLARYAEHGYDLTPDYRFNYGKIHVRLLGYNPDLAVGVLYVAREDYEAPATRPGAEAPARGLFYTVKDPEKVSAPELIMLEQLNAEERLRIAFINAYQFCTDPQNPEATTARAWQELDARLDLYLAWLDTHYEDAPTPSHKEP